jgi:acetyl esterase/lipase
MMQARMQRQTARTERAIKGIVLAILLSANLAATGQNNGGGPGGNGYPQVMQNNGGGQGGNRFQQGMQNNGGWQRGNRYPQGRPGFRQRRNWDQVTVHKDVAYVPGSTNPAQSLDLYIPDVAIDASKEESKSPRLLPLVIWIHGGGWKAGTKDSGPFRKLVYSGYAIASINYRLVGEAIFPAQIYDCKAAIRWLRAHAGEYKIDPNRIGVWGGSAGGHLAALVGTSIGVKSLEGDEGNLETSSAVQAVADWYGMHDLVKALKGNLRHLPPPQPGKPMGQGGVLGLVSSLEQARQASPTTYVSKDNPPFLILHGDADPVVPVAQSTEFYEKLKAAGVPATLHVFPGAGHGLQGLEGQATDMTLKFFDQYLK